MEAIVASMIASIIVKLFTDPNFLKTAVGIFKKHYGTTSEVEAYEKQALADQKAGIDSEIEAGDRRLAELSGPNAGPAKETK